MPGPKLGQTLRPSVVIVTWNGGPLLATCIQAIRQQTLPPTRTVIIVARPKDIPIPSDVEVIRSPQAQGYAASVNLGLNALPSGPIVVLNDDTQPAPDFLWQLNQAYQQRGEGIFCPQIRLSSTGRHLDNTGHRLFFDGYNLARGRGAPVEDSIHHPSEVGACSGAAFMLSPLAREQVGMFDADLESFGEDLDLSLRARRLGFKIHYVHEAKTLHALGASYGRVSAKKIYLVERNRFRAALRSLPISAIATMPAWTGLRLASMGLSAGLGRGPGAGAGFSGAAAAIVGGLAGLASAPDALRKRAKDRPKWKLGEREMWAHLVQHRVRAQDLVGRT